MQHKATCMQPSTCCPPGQACAASYSLCAARHSLCDVRVLIYVQQVPHRAKYNIVQSLTSINKSLMYTFKNTPTLRDKQRTIYQFLVLYNLLVLNFITVTLSVSELRVIFNSGSYFICFIFIALFYYVYFYFSLFIYLFIYLLCLQFQFI